VAIARNEEEDLPRFLEHLLPWVDEIVLVDDGSTDRTVALARAAGPKVRCLVSPRRPGEHYSDQRNKGIAAARSDWLLHMDVDERVTPELAVEIRAAIREADKDGFRFRRQNFFLHRPMRGGGWQRWNLVHLARRERFRFGGLMHETCLLEAPPERVGQLRGRMWHLNDRDFGERLRKSLTYGAVEAKDWLRTGRRAGLRHLLLRPLGVFAKTYALRGGWRDGVAGLIWSLHAAGAAFRVAALVWDRQHPQSRAALEDALRNQWKAAGKAPDGARQPPRVEP
jgi:glycosyltransferase involved in cell wall biosynthesis